MTRVITTLTAHHNIRTFCDPVNNFTFPLVTPLSADNHTSCHIYILHVTVETIHFYYTTMFGFCESIYTNSIFSFFPNARAIFCNVFKDGFPLPFSILLISDCVIPVNSDNCICVICAANRASTIF